jgi:hypothetical protein
MNNYENYTKRRAQQIRYGQALDIILVALAVAFAVAGIYQLIQMVRS